MSSQARDPSWRTEKAQRVADKRNGAPPNDEDAALAAIVRSSSDAVIAKTTDGIVTSWNPGATTTYGFTPEQMIGRNIETTIPPEAVEQERERHRRVALGAPERGYQCQRLHRDGHRVDVVMSMYPVRDSAGEVTGVASISRPFSDRERADAQVASLLEAAPDAMVCVDETGRILRVNAQVNALFGYGHDELLGRSIESLLPQEARAGHPAHRAA